MKHKLINFLLATALLFSWACSDEDWRRGGSTEEYIEIGEITVNETPQSRAHDNSDNWIWVANEKIIVSAYDKDGKVLASGTYRRNMENTAWISDSPLARVGVTYKVTTAVPAAEEINSQNDAYNYVLSDYLESASAFLDDKGALTATLAHKTVDVVAVVTKGAGWESDEAFYEGLSNYTATFYAGSDYTVKGLAVAGNDESVDYNDNTDAGLAPGKKTYIFRAHIDAAKLAAANEAKTALLCLEDGSGTKLPGTYTRPDGVENGKRLKVTLTLDALSPFAARSAEKDASALKCGMAVVEPWLGRDIPSTLWNGSEVSEVIPEGDIYTISTAAQLAWVAQETNKNSNTFAGKTIQLANNISLGDQPWTPIGNIYTPFTGTLDGCGFVISGLKVNITGSNNAGLFERIDKDGNVKNLSVTGTVTSNKETGSIAGSNYGTIQNCYTNVAVTSTSTTANYGAGGIVGYNLGTIQNCYTTGAVTCEKGYAGGIAGTSVNASGGATIQYCYATGAIKGNQAGGITGSLDKGGDIKNCIALNSSIIGTTAGRITGFKENYVAVLADNYAALSIPGTWVTADKVANGISGADLTATFTTDGADASAFSGWTADNWDFTTTTANLPVLKDFKADQPANERAPFLKQPDIIIQNSTDLIAFRDAVKAGTTYEGATVTLAASFTVSGWDKGIEGSYSKPFLGTFDGAGYVITLTGSTSLFANLGKEGKGTVQNLGVKVAITTSEISSTAGIVSVNNGTIRQCYTEGTITNNKGYGYAGGIAGQNNGIIRDCYSAVSITVEKGAGGIAQINKDNGIIERCYATGAITGEEDGTGGIVGSNYGRTSCIENCIALNTSINETYNSGRITGNSNSSDLTNNYAAPSISGTWNNKGADKLDGADLPSTFATDGAGQGVFTGWTATDWDFTTAPANLPTLQGFKSDQPVKDMQRAPFLEVPTTTITTQEELVAIKYDLSGSYKLGGNITLTDDWTPLGDNFYRFTGTLDGCGYTISGLNVSMTETDDTYAGLFGAISKDGTVKNLGVTGSVTVTSTGINGYVYAGGIVGLSAGKIMNCYTNVTVDATGSNTYAGGIVGHFNADPTISNCFATGNCTATATGTDTSAAAGGILGGNYGNGGIISYSFATGTVEAKGATSSKYAGGIAGQSGIVMTGCIALNKGITGASGKTNRIAGNYKEKSFADCYASPAIPGTWSEIGAAKKDGADLTSANFITSNNAFTGDWTTAGNWKFADKAHLPQLLTTDKKVIVGQTAIARESFLMLIKNKADLMAFRDGVNATPNDYKGKTIVLAADINLGNENWTPIGKAASSSFMGTFDGGGHRISGLTVTLNSSAQYEYGGLFGYIGSGGCVKNLGVSGEKVDVTSSLFVYAGGIAGGNMGKIENCYTDITVKVFASYAHAGGIAGLNGMSGLSSNISNCYAVGNVTSSYYSGGIAGLSAWGSISNCFATGKVDGKRAAGGITTQSSKSVTNCIALNTGGITCTDDRSKFRISNENKESYASPLIPGIWNNTTTDGTSLAWNNYMTAVDKWPSASWSNTKNSAKLPILKGFGTNQPAALLRWVSFLPVK